MRKIEFLTFKEGKINDKFQTNSHRGSGFMELRVRMRYYILEHTETGRPPNGIINSKGLNVSEAMEVCLLIIYLVTKARKGLRPKTER